MVIFLATLLVFAAAFAAMSVGVLRERPIAPKGCGGRDETGDDEEPCAGCGRG